MKKSTAFLLLALVVGVAGIAAYAGLSKLLLGRKERETLARSSDAVEVQEEIRLALDDWAGYVVLRSPEFRRLLESRRIGLAITDDKADYPERVKRLKNADYDAAVMTLDTYISLGRQVAYPGVIAFVIDVSKGGDGLLSDGSVTSIADLARPDVKIAFTPDSPSEFFIRATSVHFDIPRLRTSGDWRQKANGSEEALKMLRSGAVQVAAVWEPQLTEGRESGLTEVFTTAKTQGLILDVLVMNRQFVVQRPDAAQDFVRAYFQALRSYSIGTDAMRKELARQAGTTEAKADLMLSGIELVSLNRNAGYWMGGQSAELSKLGVTGNQLFRSIEACVSILIETGVLDADPLSGRPEQITNSSLVRAAHASGGSATSGVFGGSAPESATPAIQFPRLEAAAWKQLHPIGALRVQPVYFQSGTSLLALDGKKAVDRMADDLSHYPTYRAIVRGHTATVGDEQDNQALSEARAKAVMNYLVRNHDVDPNRLLAEGVGGRMPLQQETDESYRRWQGRLPRVELILVEDPAI